MKKRSVFLTILDALRGTRPPYVNQPGAGVARAEAVVQAVRANWPNFWRKGTMTRQRRRQAARQAAKALRREATGYAILTPRQRRAVGRHG